MQAVTASNSVRTLALLIVGVVSSFVLLILPVLVAGMVEQFGWGDREIGWLASADMGGSAIASLIALRFISRIDWKKAAYTAITFAMLGNIASIYADTFTALMLTRLSTGFSNGFILSIAFTGLCHSSDPDRYFGVYVFTQLTLQSIMLYTLPNLLDVWGMPAIYLMLVAASGLSGFLVTLFPDKPLRRQSATVGETTAPPVPGWAIVALAAQAIYFLAPAAIWGYFQPIGATFALDIGQVGKALGLASIAGILGSAVVVMLGVRFDRMLCMGIGTLLSIGAVIMLIDGSGFIWYLVAASVFSFAWNYTFPYQMGVLAIFDEQGSVAILALVVQLIGLAVGPLLAANLLIGDGYGVILWTCVACYLFSFLMFLLANRRHANVVEALQ